MQKVIETLLIGLTTGSIYALMSLAIVLVWRSTRVINFAQAGQAMFATYIGFEISSRSEVFWLGLLFAVVGGALLGAGVDYFFMRVLFKHANSGPAAVVAPVIATLGLLGRLHNWFHNNSFFSTQRPHHHHGFINSYCTCNTFPAHKPWISVTSFGLRPRNREIGWYSNRPDPHYWLGYCWRRRGSCRNVGHRK